MSLTKFENEVLAPALKQIIDGMIDEKLQDPTKRNRVKKDASFKKGGNKINISALRKYMKTPEGRTALTNPALKVAKFFRQIGDEPKVRNKNNQIKIIVNELKQRTIPRLGPDVDIVNRVIRTQFIVVEDRPKRGRPRAQPSPERSEDVERRPVESSSSESSGSTESSSGSSSSEEEEEMTFERRLLIEADKAREAFRRMSPEERKAFLEKQRKEDERRDKESNEAKEKYLKTGDKSLLPKISPIIRDVIIRRRERIVAEQAEPPKVEAKRPEIKQTVPRRVSVDFTKDDAKDAVQAVSEEAKIPASSRGPLVRLLTGKLSVEDFLKRPRIGRPIIVNILAGLGIMAQSMSGRYSPMAKARSMDLATRLGQAIMLGAATSETLRQIASEDLDERGNIKVDKLRNKLKEKKQPEVPDDPFKKPSPAEAKETADKVVETLEQVNVEDAKVIEEQTGVRPQQLAELVAREAKQIEQTGILGRMSEFVFRFLRPIREAPAPALAVALSAIPMVSEVEVTRDGLRRQTDLRFGTGVEMPGPGQMPSPPRPDVSPQPSPPEGKVEPSPPEVEPSAEPPVEVEEEPRLPRGPSALVPDIMPTFRVKKIQIDQQQENQKTPQQARPDYIIPAQKVLDPYKDAEDRKADFQIEAGFGYEIPFALNGVILEENELMQQHMMEQEIRYRDSGISYGINDWDVPMEVGFESKANINSVPELEFDSDYQQTITFPNNTLKQNIVYNSMTDIYTEDPQDESIRESVLFGEQPTF